MPTGSPTFKQATTTTPTSKPIDLPIILTEIPTGSPITPTEIPSNSPTDKQASTPKPTAKAAPKTPPPLDLNFDLSPYQPYSTNPGFTGRRAPPFKFAHYNGSQYSTQDTPWKPGEQAYYWTPGMDRMNPVHIFSNTGTSRNGFDIYQCTEYGAELEEEMIVLKHQQLYAIKDDLDT